MAQVCLLDSDRLSLLLKDAISWSNHVSSVMVSSLNGSILAYAYRDATPSIKRMRTQSTTMTAAYTVASEDVLVFEAQNMGATSVIAPIADHVLLAVSGPTPKLVNGETTAESNSNHHDNGDGDDDDDDDEEQQRIRTDLEAVSQELAHILRGSCLH